jgi:Domain of unknown function (DUF4145)
MATEVYDSFIETLDGGRTEDFAPRNLQNNNTWIRSSKQSRFIFVYIQTPRGGSEFRPLERFTRLPPLDAIPLYSSNTRRALLARNDPIVLDAIRAQSNKSSIAQSSPNASLHASNRRTSRKSVGKVSPEHAALVDRVEALETKVSELASYLEHALEYVSSDPQSSLMKWRIVLEKLLLELYRSTMKKSPSRPMIGDMLSDKAFTSSIPRRIVARMNAIRDMSNFGPHGEAVDATDAVRVMKDLIDVLEWYVVDFQPGTPRR